MVFPSTRSDVNILQRLLAFCLWQQRSVGSGWNFLCPPRTWRGYSPSPRADQNYFAKGDERVRKLGKETLTHFSMMRQSQPTGNESCCLHLLIWMKVCLPLSFLFLFLKETLLKLWHLFLKRICKSSASKMCEDSQHSSVSFSSASEDPTLNFRYDTNKTVI